MFDNNYDEQSPAHPFSSYACSISLQFAFFQAPVTFVYKTTGGWSVPPLPSTTLLLPSTPPLLPLFKQAAQLCDSPDNVLPGGVSLQLGSTQVVHADVQLDDTGHRLPLPPVDGAGHFTLNLEVVCLEHIKKRVPPGCAPRFVNVLSALSLSNPQTCWPKLQLSLELGGLLNVVSSTSHML